MRSSLLLLLLPALAGCGTTPKPPPPTPSQEAAARGAKALAGGDLARAEARYREALAAARRSGDAQASTQALFNLAALLTSAERPREALILADQIVEAQIPPARQYEFRLVRARMYLQLEGGLDAAENELNLLAMSAPPTAAEASVRAAIALKRQDWAGLAESIQRMDAAEPDRQAYAARLALHQQNPAGAATLFQQAAEDSRRLGLHRSAAFLLRDAALAYDRAGQPAPAAQMALESAQTCWGLGLAVETLASLELALQQAEKTTSAPLRRHIGAFAKEVGDAARAALPPQPVDSRARAE